MKGLLVSFDNSRARIVREIEYNPKVVQGMYVRSTTGEGEDTLYCKAYIFPLEVKEPLEAALNELNRLYKEHEAARGKILFDVLQKLRENSKIT